MKDEIRGVYSMHGLADIPEEGFDVEICFCWHGIMFAICEFKYNDDTREVFSMYVEMLWSRTLANSAG